MLIKGDKSELYFVGNTQKISFITDVGVYETANFEGLENNLHGISVLLHSSLLSYDPLPQSFIKITPVWLEKYTPCDAKS